MKHIFTSALHRKNLRELESLRSQVTKDLAGAERAKSEAKGSLDKVNRALAARRTMRPNL
jgi:hypothetical protein